MKLFIPILCILFFAGFLQARSKYTEQVVEWTGDGILIRNVVVSTNSTVLYSPDERRSERRITFMNPSNAFQLYITTYSMTNPTTTTPAYVLGVSTSNYAKISLSNSTTLYAVYNGPTLSVSENLKLMIEFQK